MDNIDSILSSVGISSTSMPQTHQVPPAPVPQEPQEESLEEPDIQTQDITEEEYRELFGESMEEPADQEEPSEEETDDSLGDFLSLLDNYEADEVLQEQRSEGTSEEIETTEEEEEEEEGGANTEEDETAQITPNSPTLLIDDATSRFSGAEWFSEIQKQAVIIAGVGGIGSNLAFQIARMSPARIALYDPDTVETANMSGQLYRRMDVGDYKVTAMENIIRWFTTTYNIYAVQERFYPSTDTADIMMCGFDNMEARRTFFASWYRHISSKPAEDRAKCLYLDGRLSMDTLQVLCIRGDDDFNIQRYKDQFLFSDAEAEETVCSMKQTTYMACMIGSVMTNLFVNFVANQLEPILPYDLPFFTEYDSQNMIFKTEH